MISHSRKFYLINKVLAYTLLCTIFSILVLNPLLLLVEFPATENAFILLLGMFWYMCILPFSFVFNLILIIGVIGGIGGIGGICVALGNYIKISITKDCSKKKFTLETINRSRKGEK